MQLVVREETLDQRRDLVGAVEDEQVAAASEYMMAGVRDAMSKHRPVDRRDDWIVVAAEYEGLVLEGVQPEKARERSALSAWM